MVQSWRLSSKACMYTASTRTLLFPLVTPFDFVQSWGARSPSLLHMFLLLRPLSIAHLIFCQTSIKVHHTDLIHHHRRQGFGRANTKSNSNLKAAAANGASAAANTNVPPLPPLANSPSVSSSLSMDSNYSDGENKRFFNEKYAKCSVKGNFLTLAAQPKNVELGEWLAHQCKD